MMHYFVYDNVPSSDFGCEVSDLSTWDSTSFNYEFVSIPNRIGDYAKPQYSYNNIEIRYRCMWKDGNFAEGYNALREHLMGGYGYKVLWDNYHENEFRYGVVSAPLAPVRLGYPMVNGYVDVAFNCIPQRYIAQEGYSIERDITVNSPNTVSRVPFNNPTNRYSHPYIYIDGTKFKVSASNGNFEYDASSYSLAPEQIFLDLELGVLRYSRSVNIWTPSGIETKVYPGDLWFEGTQKYITWMDSSLLTLPSGRNSIQLQGKGFIRPRWYKI